MTKTKARSNERARGRATPVVADATAAADIAALFDAAEAGGEALALAVYNAGNNRFKPLLDPYARALSGSFKWDFNQAFGYIPGASNGDLSFSTSTNLTGMPKCVVYGQDGFDWQGDRPLNRPLNETIIYETHVRSLTYHPSSGVEYPGTYMGVVEKIPYFKELGVTTIELLPIHIFNEWEFARFNPKTGERLRNYWGYNTLGFFAPKGHYSHRGAERGQQVIAFKEPAIDQLADNRDLGGLSSEKTARENPFNKLVEPKGTSHD